MDKSFLDDIFLQKTVRDLQQNKTKLATKMYFIHIKHPEQYTGSFRMNENLYMLISQGCGALLELRQVAKFY